MRKALLGVALAAAALLLVKGCRGNRAEVRRVQAEAARLSGQRDSLLTVVTQRETEAAALRGRVLQYEGAAAMLRDSVAALERRRAADQLTVRRLRTTGALVTRLRAAFPEFGDSAWGLTTLPIDARDTIGIEYLMLPAWFAETFVIDHANAESWAKQKDRLLAVDSLRLAVAALQDSIGRLVTANARAYRAGYDAAYAGYRDVSGRYVAELQKPRLSLGRSIGLIAAAGAGFILGRAIHE